jgi:hypothetical protein
MVSYRISILFFFCFTVKKKPSGYRQVNYLKHRVGLWLRAIANRLYLRVQYAP